MDELDELLNEVSAELVLLSGSSSNIYLNHSKKFIHMNLENILPSSFEILARKLIKEGLVKRILLEAKTPIENPEIISEELWTVIELDVEVQQGEFSFPYKVSKLKIIGTKDTVVLAEKCHSNFLYIAGPTNIKGRYFSSLGIGIFNRRDMDFLPKMDVQNIYSLYVDSVSHADLSEIYFTNLNSLFLNRVSQSIFPTNIGLMPKLESLKIFRGIVTLPANLSSSSSLKFLKLRYIKLTEPIAPLILRKLSDAVLQNDYRTQLLLLSGLTEDQCECSAKAGLLFSNNSLSIAVHDNYSLLSNLSTMTQNGIVRLHLIAHLPEFRMNLSSIHVKKLSIVVENTNLVAPKLSFETKELVIITKKKIIVDMKDINSVKTTIISNRNPIIRNKKRNTLVIKI